MARVELPNGNWAEIRDVADLKAKDKIAVERTVVFLQPQTPGEAIPMHAGIAEDMIISMLCRTITSWSFDRPLPATPQVIEDLDLATYDALCAAVSDHMDVVRAAPNRKTPSA